MRRPSYINIYEYGARIRHTYIHTYIHTRIHTYTHTYIYIYLAHGLKMLLEHAYVSIRQHTSAYVSIHIYIPGARPQDAPGARIRQHTSAYVSIRQHTHTCTWRTASRCSWSTHCSSARSARRLHTSAYVSIRQHTSAYVSIRQHTSRCSCSRRLGALGLENKSETVSICTFVLVKQVKVSTSRRSPS
jgi:hypothetical protein